MARELCRSLALAVLVAAAIVASSIHLFAQSKTGTASLAVQVDPADLLTISGGTTVSLKIRLGTGPAYLWGDSAFDCNSAPTIGNPTTISTSGTYTPLLTAVPFNTTSNDYVCVYDPGTTSLNTYVAWPHNGLALAFSQQPTNTAAGVSISPAVTVQVKDSNGILVASSTASVALAITSGTPTTGGPGTLSGTLTQTAVNGVATFNNLSVNTAGTGYSLTATSTGVSAGTSSTFNVTGGAVDHFAISTISSPQTAGTAFQIATIAAKDTNNNTVTGFTSTVTFGGTAGVTGTSAAFTAGILSNASVTPTVAGSNLTLTVTDGSSHTGSASIATINPGSLASFAFALASPQTNGVAFTGPNTLTAKDASGNTITNFNASTNNVIISAVSPLSGTVSGIHGSNVLNLSGDFTNGVANLTSLGMIYTGNAATGTFTATSGGKTGTSGSVTVNAGPLDHFLVEKSGGGAIGTQTAGTAFSLRITAQDVNNNTVTSFTSSASLTSTGALTVSPVTSGAFTAGVLDPQSVTITNTGSFTITATASSKTGTGAAFTVNSGALDHFKVEQSGGGTIGTQTAGTAFILRITAQDVNNNTVTSFTSTASLTSSGALTGSPVPSGAFTSGVLDPQSVKITNTGSFTITATASAKTGTSTAFTVNPGAAAKLAFTTQPGGGTGGTAWTTQPVVTVEDTNGNTVTSSSASIKLSPSSGTFTCTTNPLAALSGVATFASCEVNSIGSGYTLTATSSGLTSATSSAFTITAGTATQLVFTTEPVGGIYSNSFPTQPAVTVQDAGGNTVTTSSASITLAIGTNPSGGVLSGCSSNPLTATGGTASFLSCKISNVTSGNGFTLTATSSGLSTATSTSFDITAGAGLSTPTVGAQTPNPLPRGGSATYSVSVSISPVSACTATLSIAGLTGGASGSFSPSQLVFDAQSPLTSTLTVTTLTTTPVGTQSGINISANGSNGCSGTYTHTTTLVVSGAANPANPSNSTVTASPISIAADGSTPSTITVTLKDASSNPVSGKTVTLAQGSGHSTISAASGPSNSSGVVTFTVTNATAEAVTYTATDTTDSITINQKPVVTFTASKLAFITAPISATAGVCSSQITVQTLDGSNNPTNPSSLVTVALSSNSTGTKGFYSDSGCTASITSVTVATSANAASFYYKDTKAASPVITAAATGGVTSTPTQTETVNGAAAGASLSTVSASPTSLVADGATTSTITVTLLDAYGNPVSGKTVTLAQGTGHSTISAASGSSNSSGVVTFTVKDTTAEAVIYTATDTTDGVTVAPSTATVTFTASKLAITSVNGGANPTAGAAFSVVVQAQDFNGNPANVVANTAVTLSRNAGTGTLGGTLTGTISAGTNSATISGVTYTKAESNVILTATRTSGDSLTIGNSAPFTVNPGAVNSFAISAISGSKTAGTAFTITTITALDANSNTATGFTSPVTFGGTAGVTGTSGAFTAGVLSNASVAPTVAGSNLTVTVNDGSGHTGSATIVTVNPAAATKLAYTTVPTTGTAGTAFSVTVQSQDAYGNPASPTSNTTITLSKASGGGTLSGTLTGTISTSGNSVTISTPVYSKSDTMTLTATAAAGETSLTAVTSGNIVFSAGAPYMLIWSVGPPSSITRGTAISNAMIVLIEDQNGNLTTSTASVALTLYKPTGNDSVSVGTPVTAVSGTATFPSNTVKLGGNQSHPLSDGCYLTASSSGLTSANSTTFAIQ